jgi:hypothetical protein
VVAPLPREGVGFGGMNTEPTIATAPCFSGAPWKVVWLTPFHNYTLHTMRLPEAPAERREL